MKKYTFPQDVEILKHQAVYQGYFRVDNYQLRYRRFAGDFSEVINREVFERGQVAALLPYDPILDKIVLIDQFRVGALKDEHSPWLTEIVAGIIEAGETAEQVAIREADEEAGLVVKQLLPAHHYWVSPGGCTERVMLFCGIVDASQAGGIFGMAAEHEDIRVSVKDRTEAYEDLNNGRLNNALTIIALQWLELNYQELREKYGNQ